MPFVAFTVMMGWVRPEKLVAVSVSGTPGHTPRRGLFTIMNLNPIFLANSNVQSFQSHFENIRADEFYEEQV